MNVVIPLGGIGSRFQKEGYLKPKPFVRVLGKEMILWVTENLTLGRDDLLVVVYNPTFMDMKESMELVTESVGANCVLVELAGPTRGAAETVKFGLLGLDANRRKRPCLLVDGDTFYTADVVGLYRSVSERGAGATFVFHDTQPKPIYSYVSAKKLEEEEDFEEHDAENNKTSSAAVGSSFAVGGIREKVKISDWANTGCYCFPDGEILLDYCEAIISRGETQLSQDQKGEFYTSGVIKAMLDDSFPFEAIVLDKADMHVLGTPSQLTAFCRAKQPEALRVCFDLDNTLFTSPKVQGDYSTCEPIERTVAMLKALYDNGHYVILATARRMRTHKANVGAVVADVGAVTLETLQKAKVPYHEIHFGKPWAQFYVDDKAVNAFTDLEKELGYYLPLDNKALPSKFYTNGLLSKSPSSASIAQKTDTTPTTTERENTTTTTEHENTTTTTEHKNTTPTPSTTRRESINPMLAAATTVLAAYATVLTLLVLKASSRSRSSW